MSIESDIAAGGGVAGPPAASSAAPGRASRTPWQTLWLKLKKNRTAMVALYVLVALYLIAVLADFIAPYHYETLDQDRPF